MRELKNSPKGEARTGAPRGSTFGLIRPQDRMLWTDPLRFNRERPVVWWLFQISQESLFPQWTEDWHLCRGLTGIEVFIQDFHFFLVGGSIYTVVIKCWNSAGCLLIGKFFLLTLYQSCLYAVSIYFDYKIVLLNYNKCCFDSLIILWLQNGFFWKLPHEIQCYGVYFVYELCFVF